MPAPGARSWGSALLLLGRCMPEEALKAHKTARTSARPRRAVPSRSFASRGYGQQAPALSG